MNNLNIASHKPSVIFYSQTDGDFHQNVTAFNKDIYEIFEITNIADLKKYTEDETVNLSALVFSTDDKLTLTYEVLEQLDPKYRDIGGPVIAVYSETDVFNEEDLLKAGVTKIFHRKLGLDSLNTSVAMEIDEFARIKKLREELERRTSAVGQIVEGVFRFKTRREAQNLATMLSLTCPNPMPVAIGLAELLINGVEHGCLGIGHDEKGTLIEKGILAEEISNRRNLPEYIDKNVELKFARYDDHLVFEIFDGGDGFDYETYLTAEQMHLKKHGRGIIMAKGCFEELVYSGNGNQVRAVHRFET